MGGYQIQTMVDRGRVGKGIQHFAGRRCEWPLIQTHEGIRKCGLMGKNVQLACMLHCVFWLQG